MRPVDVPAESSPRLLDLALPWLAAGVFFSVMFFFFPFFDRFEFDQDEGFNLIKAMLLTQGYSLYQEIWSDQPPLLTYLLAVVFRFFGFDVVAARIVVLLLSSLLVGAACQFLRLVGGNLYAAAGFLMLMLTPHFGRLSVSVMIGLPALALAMAALMALAIWHRRRKTLWLVLSALALSLSVMTKLFTGFLAVIFVGGLVLGELSRPEALTWPQRLRPAVVWSLTFGFVTLGLLGLFVGPAGIYHQLVAGHLAAREASLLQSYSLSPEALLADAEAMLLLAFLGAVLVVRSRRWMALYLLAWSALAFLLLAYHAPVWYHHRLLFTIPVALLAACAGGEVMRACQPAGSLPAGSSKSGAALLATTAILLVIMIATKTPEAVQFFKSLPFSARSEPAPPLPEQVIVAKIREYAPQTDWLVTDRPMYAFRAGVAVPPHLAVISAKRLATGALTEQAIFETIQTWEPRQILIARFPLPPTMKAYLEEHYRVIHSQAGQTLYLREGAEPLP